MKFNTTQMEIAVANYFNPRVNIIVPNVWWGLELRHEADILVVTPSGYATEVEIKVSESDLKLEHKKYHKHRSEKIRRFYYAIPENLKDSKYMPEYGGIIIVHEKYRSKVIRAPRINKCASKLSKEEINKLLHLGCMRIWNLKEKLNKLRK